MRLKLKILQAGKTEAWYAQGLRFTCTECGNCCTGGPGYVWISKEEIIRLAEYLKLSPQEVVERYCRRLEGKFSLSERLNNGLYDCVFLREQKPAGAEGTDGQPARRICSIYPVRPLQCRTWPFWSANLQSRKAWDLASGRCPGMNSGRQYSPQQIEAIRDSADWPKDPPSSQAP